MTTFSESGATPLLMLTGCNGQLGFELQRALMPLGKVLAMNRQVCDLADPASLREQVAQHRPRIIINAAAYTAVDRAEAEPELAQAINTHAPGVLGQMAAETGALLIHYSTDYVFDGRLPHPYAESEKPNPLNVYGQSKLAGEEALISSGARHLIFRTSWVFGAHGNNFAKTVLRLAAERETLKIVSDQTGAPTPASLIADITAQIAHRWLKMPEQFPTGRYHLSASGKTNWHDYAAHVIAAARKAAYPLKLAENGLIPIKTCDYPLPAARPANSCLDCTLLAQTFGLRLPPWEEGLDHVLQQIL